MQEFTYTVFVVVAATVGALVTLFAGMITGALLYDAGPPKEQIVEPLPASRRPLPRAA